MGYAHVVITTRFLQYFIGNEDEMSLVHRKIKTSFIYEFCVMMTEKQNNTDLSRSVYSKSVNKLSVS